MQHTRVETVLKPAVVRKREPKGTLDSRSACWACVKLLRAMHGGVPMGGLGRGSAYVCVCVCVGGGVGDGVGGGGVGGLMLWNLSRHS